MTTVTGKRVLVTGGSRGIGLLVAKRLAAHGANVTLWARDARALEAAARSIGPEVTWAVVDVGNRRAVEAAAAKLGPIDVLINNAGVVSGKSFVDLEPADIERTFATNALAHFWTLRAFLPGMIARDAGHVVTVASGAGTCGMPKLADYCASKFAAFGLDESLRLELRRRRSNVMTTVVCPYYIDTGMFRGAKTRFSFLLPILRPDDVAQRIVHAILHDRRRVIIPRVIAITWLARLLPVSWFDAVADFLGLTVSMDEFVGHAAPLDDRRARPRVSDRPSDVAQSPRA